MASVKAWLSATRPRTLLLAAATTLTGTAVAMHEGCFSWTIAILTLLTATGLQLLSNLANDLGDYQHGTDTTGQRVGPRRALQSGSIQLQEMQRGIGIAIFVSCVVGSLLMYQVMLFVEWWHIAILAVFGLLSVVAAITYTAGKHPYGYIGLGDLFSFVFFGLVAVIGTYFLHSHQLTFRPVLPAIGMGCFTVLVLNINNMRDIDNDIRSGKITIAARLGFRRAKIYHTIVLAVALLCFVGYSALYTTNWSGWLHTIAFVPHAVIVFQIWRTREKSQLDHFLKKTALATLLLSVLFI